MKVKWRVDPEPTGRYRSFDKRGWPSAHYFDEAGQEQEIAASISCDKEYDPAALKRGDQFELKLRIADHSRTPWRWVVAKKVCTTVKECKDLLTAILKQQPEFVQKKK